MLMSSQDVCYRKGSGWNFHNLEVFFSYSQQLEEKYITPCLKLARRAIFLPPSKVYIRSFSVTITLIKFLLQKTVSDSLSLVLELNLLWRQRISQNIVNVHLSTSSISLGSEQMLSSLNTSMVFSSIQFSSVTQLSPTVCNPMDCSMLGLHVHHQLLKFTQTHVLWISDATQRSHPPLSSSPPAFCLSKHQGLFQCVSYLHQVAKVLEFKFQHQSFQWIFRTDFL